MEPLLNFLTADLHNAQLVTGPPQSTVAIDRPTPRFPHIQGGGKSTSPSIADFPVDLVVWFVSKIVRMVRKARIEYAGAYYHVINRGNYRSWIFESDGARKSFLECLVQACESMGWRVHAWCLMGNHYHLCLQTPDVSAFFDVVILSDFWS